MLINNCNFFLEQVDRVQDRGVEMKDQKMTLNGKLNPSYLV